MRRKYASAEAAYREADRRRLLTEWLLSAMTS
jgi:hypothetical protein